MHVSLNDARPKAGITVCSCSRSKTGPSAHSWLPVYLVIEYQLPVHHYSSDAKNDSGWRLTTHPSKSLMLVALLMLYRFSCQRFGSSMWNTHIIWSQCMTFLKQYWNSKKSPNVSWRESFWDVSSHDWRMTWVTWHLSHKFFCVFDCCSLWTLGHKMMLCHQMCVVLVTCEHLLSSDVT